MSAGFNATQFIKKWGPGGAANGLSERAGAQSHFIDLCRLLGVPEPGDPDRYCFERGLHKSGGAGHRIDGFADVWLKGCFAWEYKAPGSSLASALAQLMMYALPLESPPLLIVSDRHRIEVHTHFTGMPSERHVFAIEDLQDTEVQKRLRAAWTNPESFRPSKSNREITEQAAESFAEMAHRLRNAGVKSKEVSHFLTQCLFCFFAEDVGLLPARLFERLVGVRIDPTMMQQQLTRLFESMRAGGMFGVDHVPWFNGGLFAVVNVPKLAVEDIESMKVASALDWSAIDPSIFGTLFERGLHPNKRSQLGAHYTDPETILRIVEPVVKRPLMADWNERKPTIEKLMTKSKRYGDKAYRDAKAEFIQFLERLREFRVLDPACGSGNFLYLSLKCLKDIEHQVNLEAEVMGLERQHDVTGPHNVLGIELDEYAAELARVTVWIGELQWRVQRGYGFKTNPILEPLDHIINGDALLKRDGRPAAWPAADVVVGNPPFVGDKKMRRELGVDYTVGLRKAYAGRVPGGADLVCFWFDKSVELIAAGKLQAAGLVSTNSIRTGRNREVLDRVAATTTIFEAWADEPWVNEGASVRVSLTAFGSSRFPPRLDGVEVERINSDLTADSGGSAAGGLDLTSAATLKENAGTSFSGVQKTGPFEVPGDVARAWLKLPNPNGRPNSDVVKPWNNGLDLLRRPRDMWICDFGVDMNIAQAALYEAPFAYVTEHVKPTRIGKREARTNESYWLFQWPRPVMRQAVAKLSRFIVTAEVAKHRVFDWLPSSVVPDKNLVVIAREDDATLGVLQSRMHQLWSLRLGSSLEDRPRYTPTSCFETFPFPVGLTPHETSAQGIAPAADGAWLPVTTSGSASAAVAAIASAAVKLCGLRNAWLSPAAWCDAVPEVVPLGLAVSPFPPRIAAKPGHEADVAARTKTNLYNQSPPWLVAAHHELDMAVAAAYGWADYSPSMDDEEVLRRLLALNMARAA